MELPVFATSKDRERSWSVGTVASYRFLFADTWESFNYSQEASLLHGDTTKWESEPDASEPEAPEGGNDGE